MNRFVPHASDALVIENGYVDNVYSLDLFFMNGH